MCANILAIFVIISLKKRIYLYTKYKNNYIQYTTPVDGSKVANHFSNAEDSAGFGAATDRATTKL